MAFGTFRLTGQFDEYDGSTPAYGHIVIEANREGVTEPTGIAVGPARVPLAPDGTFAADLPTDVSSGRSTVIQYRVSSRLQGLTNITPTQFWAPAIGTSVDLDGSVLA